MHPTVVLDVVGLTPALIGPSTPNLARLAKRGAMRPLRTVTPALTTTVQSTFLTGGLPRDHGIVANGWYFRDLSEVWLWRQSNRLVQGEKVWDTARRRDPAFTCANMFWWYNMYSAVEVGITPRPMYPADGRKIPDHYAAPPALHDELDAALGKFPLFRFWGPATDISSSRWIADAALHVLKTRQPTLTLVYLPHLDYNLQRLGPDHPDLATDLAEIDAVCGSVIDICDNIGARVLVLSEYGITEVDTPIHINRALRRAGLIQVREELGHEILDAGASRAFALADHQIAHVYVRESADLARVRKILEDLPGVEHVLDDEGKRRFGLDHARSGEFIALAGSRNWFTYYYWLEDERAPDFARTVDIHRKPGYDPVELFLDPELSAVKLRIAWYLLKKSLGFRGLMEVIPLDATLVKGSHGRLTDTPDAGPVLISSEPGLISEGAVAATEIKELILKHIFES